ncbi:MAG TPA: hypothetical protein VFM05_10015 [Candidatus Saccharimonadales bacterium]|nr:hypothetical protein [Candidatus Saccharimonadales bacterium]
MENASSVISIVASIVSIVAAFVSVKAANKVKRTEKASGKITGGDGSTNTIGNRNTIK